MVYENGDVDNIKVETRKWGLNDRTFHFDNVAKAMLTLFTISTFEGWPGYVFIYTLNEISVTKTIIYLFFTSQSTLRLH